MNPTNSSLILFFTIALPLLLPIHATAWAPKQGPLMTSWAGKVDPNNTLPEYPRPQLVRADWLNLNGIWQFQSGVEKDSVPEGKTLSGEILVPFTMESALSGVMDHSDRIWYRRMFTVPSAWKGRRVLIHFGAVDFESEVYINGKSIGIHKGGYDAFSYDITPQIKSDGLQELIVRVFDATNAAGEPRGKQSTTPGGIMYTPTTGIWQTVWLEPVAAVAITDLQIVPDVDKGQLHLTVNTTGPKDGVKVSVKIKDSGAIVQMLEAKSNTHLTIPVPNAKLWSPDSPFLYDLEISVDGGDVVTSYFGMRKVEVGEVDGVKRILLNGKYIFLEGPLDQGFWPDGIYTAPTDEALKSDIEQMKAYGFNFVRKHIKVEPARWYYWTDKLGLLVWQDMPSANSYIDKKKQPTPPPVDRPEFESELKRMVQTHWNSPSIFLWDTFNEGQGQGDDADFTKKMVDLIRGLDSSRLINEASGGKIFGFGDLNDVHNYPPPSVRPITTPQAYFCGEYGGIGYRIPGHMWVVDKGGGYTNVSSPNDLLYLYAEFMDQIKIMRDTKGLSGFVYTQLTDVENELNGLMTYDRTTKIDPAMIAKINRFEFPAPTYQAVLPTSEDKPLMWKYTTDKPAHDWNTPAFDDTKWTEAGAGFGKYHDIGTTPWKTTNIWMRRHFNPGTLTPDQIDNLVVRDFHDDDVEIFINGVRAYAQGGCITHYEDRGMTQEARKSIIPNADNLIALHCLQKGGGQYIDAGVYVRVPAQ